MLDPVFWLAFLATFLGIKTLADAWLVLPRLTRRAVRTLPLPPAGTVGSEEGEDSDEEEKEVALRRTA